MIIKAAIILWILFFVIRAIANNAVSNLTPEERAGAVLFREYPLRLLVLALLKAAVGIAAIVATIVWIIGL